MEKGKIIIEIVCCVRIN